VYQGASEDGSKVFFTSQQELLRGKGDTLYEYDFDAASPHQRLSVLAPEVEGAPVISQDGARVYFQSPAVLNSAANGNGEHATLYGQNLYVYDTDDGSAGSLCSSPSRPVKSARRVMALSWRSKAPGMSRDRRLKRIPQLFEYDAETV